MADPESPPPASGPGGRIARFFAVAAPLLAWLVALLNVLVLSRSELGPSLDPRWGVLAVAAVAAVVMALLVRRMLTRSFTGRELFMLLGLPALPWLLGSLTSLLRSEAGLSDMATAGFAGDAASFAAGMQGASTAWSLFGAAAFALTVATFIRRARPVHLADGVPVALALVPVIVLAIAVFSGTNEFTTNVIANPIAALFLLPFAGAATRRNPPDATTLPGIGAGWAFALSFTAAASSAFAVGISQMLFAVQSTASAGAELWQAGLADLDRLRLGSLLGILLALLPAGTIAWQLRREGRTIEAALLPAAAVLVICVGLQLVFASRAQATLTMLASQRAVIPSAADSAAAPIDSQLRAGIVTSDSLPTVPGGVVGGIPSGQATPIERLETPAQLISSVPPAYPETARQARIEGAVVVEVKIDSTGRVTEAVAVTGPQLLRDAAVAAVRQWRYRPAFQSSRPVGTRKAEIVNFRLNP